MEKRRPGRPKKLINAPEVDKMVKEPEKEKGSISSLPPDSPPNIVIRGLVRNPFAALVDRERAIHGGSGAHR